MNLCKLVTPLLVVIGLAASLPACSAISKELRSGWVKVEFSDGKYHDEVVCRLDRNAEGDTEGKCIPLDDYLTAILEKLDGLGMLKTQDEHRGEL